MKKENIANAMASYSQFKILDSIKESLSGLCYSEDSLFSLARVIVDTVAAIEEGESKEGRREVESMFTLEMKNKIKSG